MLSYLIACLCTLHIYAEYICFALADGNAIACLDVLQITHAAISLVNLMFETHKIHDRGSYFIGYFEEENAVVIQCVVCLGLCPCFR